MTVYMIAGKPHIETFNGFQAISEHEYYMAIEQGEIDHVTEVEIYD